jgi:hypothetical protein
LWLIWDGDTSTTSPRLWLFSHGLGLLCFFLNLDGPDPKRSYVCFLLVFLTPCHFSNIRTIAGKEVYYLYPGENRPRQDAATYGRRTAWTNFGLFQNGFELRAAGYSMIDTLRTMVFPNIIWVIAINSMFISIQGAAGQTGSSILIAAGYVISLPLFTFLQTEYK